MIVPLVIIALSLGGVLNAFGRSPLGVSFWILGVGFAISLGYMLSLSRHVIYSADTKTLSVTGSWMPLAVMMTIFFIKDT